MSPDLNLWYLIAHPGSASIAFQSPALLALAAGAVLLFYVARRDTVRRRAAMWCRIAAFCLVVLALAGMTLATRLPDDRLSLIALLDASQSIDAEGRAWQERYVERAEQALAPGDEIGVIKFGRDAVVVRPPGTKRSAPIDDDVLRPTATDIGKALDTAMALFPPDVERRILLLSDGNETRGSSLASVPRALRSQVSIFAAVPPHSAGADVSVEKLLVPPVVAEGAVFPVRVVLRNRGRGRDATLSLQLDGESLGEERVALSAGLNAVEIPYRMHGTGARKLRATIFAPDDAVRANDYREEPLTIGSHPRVLIVSTRARPPLAVVLERKDVAVTLQRPEALPAGAEQLARYDAVILDDPVAADFDGARLNAVERYVRELGGGLIVAGGRMTYGDEHFKRTALERLLPVSLEPRRPPRVEREPLALFLVVDVSNSMGYHFRDRLQRSESESKLVYAKRAALAVLSQLKDTDHVGLLIFNSAMTEIAPLRRVGENRALLEQQIPRLQPGGGTDFYEALASAHRQLIDARIATNHVILLTDGDTNRDADSHRQLIDRIAADAVSVSTIRIGDDVVNLKLLTDISTRTGGQFYHVENAETLPALMLKDATKAMAQVERSGESYAPRVAGRSQILSGVDARQIPDLRGYAFSRPRPSADILLDVAVEGRNDPILAAWQYGLGRVVALTASMHDDAEMWIAWDGLGKLWSQIGRWAGRAYSPWNYAIDVERGSRESTLTVRSFGELGDGILRARLRPHPDRQVDVALVPQAPRVFTARIPTLLGGKYPVTVVRRTAGGDVSELTQTVFFPAKDAEPQEEFLADRPNTLLLQRLTAATGGAVDAPLREVVRREPGTRRVEHRLDWLLIPLAMVFFLADVGLRRLGGDAPDRTDQTDRTEPSDMALRA
jgi:Mg-chelatase subunit ChlD